MKRIIIGLSIWSLSSLAQATSVLNCSDPQSFNFGQIQMNESGDHYQLLLRGYPSHGTTATALAKDLGVDDNHNWIWAGVTIPKDNCRIHKSEDKLVATCVHTEGAHIDFFSGWQQDDLTLIASVPAELEVIVDNETVKTFAPRGYARLPSEDEEPEVIEVVNARVIVSNETVYRSPVSVALNQSDCI